MSNQVISLFMLRFTLFSLICLLSLLPVRSQTDCPNPYDGNGDGAVTVIDLLGLLLVFGDFDLDGDGVWDSVDECIDLSACNFDLIPTAPCLYIDALGDCGECEADEDTDGVCDDVDVCIGELDECGVCNGPGAVLECGCFEIPSSDCDCNGNQTDALGVCGGFCEADLDADGLCDDADECVGSYDACFVCNGPGDVYACGCSDIPEGDCDCEGNQLDALGFCGGSCLADDDMDGVCDIVDDCVGSYDECGVCNGPGVIYECGCVDIPEGDCDCDGNQLDALGLCGGDCGVDADADGICDDVDECFDIEACNYTSPSNEPCAFTDALGICGGTCSGDGDADGICDDVDTCFGDLDECGICNGPGPTELVIEEIVTIHDSTYQEESGTWEVFQTVVDTVFGYTCSPIFESCGLPLTYQGYEYATVEIDGRCWFAENLRSEKYANSESIPSGLDAEAWTSTSEGALATYGETSQCTEYAPGFDACDSSQSLQAYGRLYNWYAVTDLRELCPTGWHVPTDLEWSEFIDEGGFEFASDELKSTYGWEEGNGTNSSGFNGLPAGTRFSDGVFEFAGRFSGWWSSSQKEESDAGENAWARFLNSTGDNVIRDYRSTNDGWSVRCVQDTN